MAVIELIMASNHLALILADAALVLNGYLGLQNGVETLCSPVSLL